VKKIQEYIYFKNVSRFEKFIETSFWKDFECEKLLKIVNKIYFSRLYSSKDFNPKDFCEKLTEKLCIAWNSIIPLKKFKPRIRSSTPWINAEVIALVRERNFYYKKSLNACLPHEYYYNIYFYRNKSANSMKYHNRNYFKKLIKNNKNSSRNLWRILTSVLKFDITFSTKESETEIDIENINEYFVSEPQKVSNECVSSTKEPKVTDERIESHLNTDFDTPNNYFNFRNMSENDLKEALNGMYSKS
jgi:hypothetical protein